MSAVDELIQQVQDGQDFSDPEEFKGFMKQVLDQFADENEQFRQRQAEFQEEAKRARAKIIGEPTDEPSKGIPQLDPLVLEIVKYLQGQPGLQQATLIFIKEKMGQIAEAVEGILGLPPVEETETEG